MAGVLARSPIWLQNVAFGLLRVVMKALYFVPTGHVRQVAVNFSKQIEDRSPRELYFCLIDGLVRMIRALEVLSRHGAVDSLPEFTMSEQVKQMLDERVGKGAILAMPHSTGSLLAVHALARDYDILMLIREPLSEERARTQRRFFENLGCEILDVRRTEASKVARTLFKALRSGRFVVGTVDRIRSAPPHRKRVHRETDTIYTKVFGSEVGATGWPARFAHKCQLPILPLMPLNTINAVKLEVGAPVIATGDLIVDTQAWLDALILLFKQYPDHWMFAYDRRWAKALKKASD